MFDLRARALLLLPLCLTGLTGCVEPEPADEQPRDLGIFAPPPLTPTRYLTIDGLQIAAYEGPGHKGPGVLLLHGNTSSANAFARILKSSLLTGRRVVAIDLPGYGNSDDAEYDIATFTSVVAQAAAQLGVDDGVMVGWSLGGDFLLQTAHLLPDVKGYFLFGTAPVGGGPADLSPFLAPAESYAGLATTYGFVADLTTDQIDEYVEAFFRPGWPHIPEFFYDDGYRTDGGTRQAVLTAASGQDPDFLPEVPVAQSLDVPIALVHAEHDAFVRLDYLEAIAPTIPNLWKHKIVVVPSSGHAIQWERPLALDLLLEAFIEDL